MGRSLRILHVTKRFWPYPGGVERYVLDLGRRQARSGHDVHVLTIDRDIMANGGGHLPPADSHDGISIHRVQAVGSPRKQLLAEMPGRALRLVRAADVVHHHEPRFLFETTVLARALVRRPVIFHSHGMIFHTPAMRGFKERVMRRYYGPLLRHGVSLVVADSSADAEILERYCGLPLGARTRLILNGIDLDRYAAIDRRPSPGRILSFGRIDEHKGHRRLLRALSTVPGSWTLDIVGTGPTEMVAALEAEASRLGIRDRVHFLGRVSDDELDALLAQSWLAAFPSEYEGFGLALVEALAAGASILASDIPAHREVVGPGLIDRLVPFDEVPAASAILAALSADDVSLRGAEAAGRRRAQQFSVDRLFRDIEALYGELGLS